MHVVFNRAPPRRKPNSHRRLRARLWAFLVQAGRKRTRLAALPSYASQVELEQYLEKCRRKLEVLQVPPAQRARLLLALAEGPRRHGFVRRTDREI